MERVATYVTQWTGTVQSSLEQEHSRTTGNSGQRKTSSGELSLKAHIASPLNLLMSGAKIRARQA